MIESTSSQSNFSQNHTNFRGDRYSSNKYSDSSGMTGSGFTSLDGWNSVIFTPRVRALLGRSDGVALMLGMLIGTLVLERIRSSVIKWSDIRIWHVTLRACVDTPGCGREWPWGYKERSTTPTQLFFVILWTTTAIPSDRQQPACLLRVCYCFFLSGIRNEDICQFLFFMI